jgi:phospholipase/carboxylesterase
MGSDPHGGSELAGFKYRFVPAVENSPRTLLLLHGTGGNETDLLDLGRSIAPNAALISPRGKVLERGMPRFFRRLAEGVFDEADLRQRTDELAKFIELACRAHKRDPQSLIAVGFSNGANIASATLFQHPAHLAGAILMRAMVPFQSQTPPPLNRKPVLMLSAENDPIVPVEETERLAELLASADADLTLQWSRTGHSLGQVDIAAATRWLEALD